MSLLETRPFHLDYGVAIEDEITCIEEQIGRFPAMLRIYPSRWLALKLLERDAEMQETLLHLPGGPALLTHAQLCLARLEAIHGNDVDALIADRRYTWIHGLVQEAVERPSGAPLTRSDKIDRIVTHRWLGVPIFLLSMWAVFRLTTDVAAPFIDWVDGVINGPLASWLAALLTRLGAGGTWVESLFIDGVLAGVGGLLVFVPVLLALYLALALLEDSGYMARAALVMDRLMSKIGLHGKSFLPLLVGFGCNVPAIYATRTLENEKDRILTGLLVPFMSCGARLPVYVLFASIFFPQQAGLVIFGLYLLGIVTALLLGFMLRRTLFRGNEPNALVMELPPYRLPTLRNVWFHVWRRTKAFLEDAWSLILATSVVIWLLMAIPVQGNGRFAAAPVEDSAFAAVSGAVAPLLRPLGFDSWEASGALISGFVAKEVVVTTLSQTYGLAEEAETAAPPTLRAGVAAIGGSFITASVETLRAIPLMVGIDIRGDAEEAPDSGLMAAIRADFDAGSGGRGALAGLAFMVFVLIYTPCMVAIAAEKQELGAKWMWVSILGQLALAWLMGTAVFQLGRLILG